MSISDTKIIHFERKVCEVNILFYSMRFISYFCIMYRGVGAQCLVWV